ncbi:MAG: cysteine synthase A [Flavobacteriaceae bacterium]|jgi:cysteine synthase A|nr:cysteine synthase A [Flavobacteriaceae bacterium]
MKVNSILEIIGNTPHVRLSKMFPDHEVYIKLEKQNPGGSIKDRIALAMIEDAEKKEILKPGGTIIEPTSGNTGVGLAWVGTVKGYRVILVMPESMSVERRRLMCAYGAELVLTPREKGMKGAIEKAEELGKEIQNSFVPQQFKNDSNPRIHIQTTAQEVIKDFQEGIDVLITGVGTGGHISGVGEVLKEKFPYMKAFAVEPISSPVISGGDPGPHPIQGIGAGFIPDTLDTKILDGSIQISKEEAFEYTRKLAKTEGILGGISTGASLAAIAKKLQEFPKGTRVLTFNYDTGERYFSVEGLF